FARRTDAPVDALESLATAGAFSIFGHDRREALWSAGALRATRPGMRLGRLPGLVPGMEAPTLPGMEPEEVVAADLWATGISPDHHPTEFSRADLVKRGVVTTGSLRNTPHGSVVEVAGLVTHRQQPETAGGVVFINLEDEDGLLNVICTAAVWARYKRIASRSPALCVRGILERRRGVTNLLAQRIEALPISLTGAQRSRDFR
ncbi:MAG: error-prone DNA polymerase, partial [Acidimicrobiia bacterium]|nr:error-prone DNA polymerase [Acidimicrobiia bacterium]